MTAAPFTGTGTADDPWVLKTPSLGSEILMHRDEDHDPPVLVCTVGTTVLHYDLRIIDDLHAMLKDDGRLGRRSGTPTSRSRRPKAPWRPGPAPRTTRSAAGTG